MQINLATAQVLQQRREIPFGDIHAPIFPSPAIKGLFADLQLFAGFFHGFALTEIDLSASRSFDLICSGV